MASAAAAKVSLDEKYEAQCKEFNDYLLSCLKDTSPLHGSIKSAYATAHKALMNPKGVSTTCEGAKKCWPFFDEFRAEIKGTDEKALIHLPSEFGNMPEAWATIDADNRHEIWIMFQEMLQLLDAVHAIIPFAAYAPIKKKSLSSTSFDGSSPTASSSSSSAAPTLPITTSSSSTTNTSINGSTNVSSSTTEKPNEAKQAAPTATAASAAAVAAVSHDAKDQKTPISEAAIPSANASGDAVLSGKMKSRMAGLLGSLGALAGMENKSSPVQAQLDATLAKLNQSDASVEFTGKDNQTLASLVQGVIDQTLPLTDDMDPLLTDPAMDPKMREELRARMELENERLKRELQQKIASVGDPDAYPKEMMEEGERRVKARAAAREAAKKTKSDSEFSLCGHFNKNLFVLVEQLTQMRGGLKSPTGGLYFPELMVLKDNMLQALQKDLATDEYIKPFGHWVAVNLAKTKSLEALTTLFKESKEPFLVGMKAQFLIQTLARNEWDAFMAKDETKRVLQFSNVYISLYKENMGEFMEWINEMLKDCGISTTQPSKINSRLLRKVLIERMHPAEIKRFEHLFSTTGKEPQEAMLDLMERLVSMMQTNKSSTVSQNDVVSAMAGAPIPGARASSVSKYTDYDD